MAGRRGSARWPSEPTPPVLRGGRAGDHPFNPEADRADRLLSVEPDGLCRGISISTGISSRSRKRSTDIFILSDLAYAEVYFDDNNPPPVGAAGARRESTSPSNSPRSVEDVLDGRLAHGLCGRQMSASSPRSPVVEVLSRLRRLPRPVQGGGDRRAQRTRTTASARWRDTYRKRRDALGGVVWPRRLGDFRRRRPRCSAWGAAAEGIRGPSAACSSQP